MANPKVTEVVVEGKDGEGYQPRLNEFSQKFIADLMEEKERLSEDFPLCMLLIEEALERIYSTGRIPGREFYADVFKQKPLKVTQKVFVPVKQYPKFNFIGKVLGPKGNSLRRLQEETQCKIVIKGRNSIRDNAKEEEMRNSGDPKYAHFNKDLYLEISTVATPAESYARVAYALAEIRKYIIPDKNDEVSQDQLREMIEINPDASKPKANVYKSVLDKKIVGTNGAPKFLNLIKKTAYHPPEEEIVYEQEPEEEEVTYEYQQPKQYIVKRPATYEYAKVRPTNLVPHKRPQPTMYTTEVKRLREAPAPPQYKPSPYAIFKKYRS